MASGGRGGIRAHEALAPLAVFKTAALNHSATLPRSQRQLLTHWRWQTKSTLPAHRRSHRRPSFWPGLILKKRRALRESGGDQERGDLAGGAPPPPFPPKNRVPQTPPPKKKPPRGDGAG